MKDLISSLSWPWEEDGYVAAYKRRPGASRVTAWTRAALWSARRDKLFTKFLHCLDTSQAWHRLIRLRGRRPYDPQISFSRGSQVPAGRCPCTDRSVGEQERRDSRVFTAVRHELQHLPHRLSQAE